MTIIVKVEVLVCECMCLIVCTLHVNVCMHVLACDYIKGKRIQVFYVSKIFSKTWIDT